MALAVLAFVASALLSRDHRRASVLSFYVLAGVLIGPLGIGLFDDISQQLLAPALALAVTWMGWLHGMQLFDRRVSRPSRRVAWAALLEAGAVVVTVTFGLHLRGARCAGLRLLDRRGRDPGSPSLAQAIFLFELFGELFGSRPQLNPGVAVALPRAGQQPRLPGAGRWIGRASPPPARTARQSPPDLEQLGARRVRRRARSHDGPGLSPRGWATRPDRARLAGAPRGNDPFGGSCRSSSESPSWWSASWPGPSPPNRSGVGGSPTWSPPGERPVALLIAVLVGIRVSPDQTLAVAGCAGGGDVDRESDGRRATAPASRVGRWLERPGLPWLWRLPAGGGRADRADPGGWIGALALTSAAALSLTSDALGASTAVDGATRCSRRRASAGRARHPGSDARTGGAPP